MKPELEPCPFCGKNIVLLIEKIEMGNIYGSDGLKSRMHAHSHWKAKCNNIYCQMAPETPDEVHTMTEALEIWNRRKAGGE